MFKTRARVCVRPKPHCFIVFSPLHGMSENPLYQRYACTFKHHWSIYKYITGLLGLITNDSAEVTLIFNKNSHPEALPWRVELSGVKPWSNENASDRKFLLVLACASFDRQLVVACVSLRLIWACSNFTASFFSTCESLRVVWTQNKSFLPTRALELVELSEL